MKTSYKMLNKLQKSVLLSIFLVALSLITYLMMLVPQLLDTELEKEIPALINVYVNIFGLTLILLNLILMLKSNKVFSRFLFLSTKFAGITMLVISIIIPHLKDYLPFDTVVFIIGDFQLFDFGYLCAGALVVSLNLIIERGIKYQFEVEEETV